MVILLTGGSRFHRAVMFTASLFDNRGRLNPYILFVIWTPIFVLPRDLIAVVGLFTRRPPVATKHFPRRRRMYWRRDEG